MSCDINVMLIFLFFKFNFYQIFQILELHMHLHIPYTYGLLISEKYKLSLHIVFYRF